MNKKQIELNCYEDCLRIIDSVDTLKQARKQIALRVVTAAQMFLREAEYECYKGIEVEKDGR